VEDVEHYRRLHEAVFPGDGRDVDWKSEEHRLRRLDAQADDYVKRLGLTIAEAVDHMISGQDPCDLRPEEAPVPLPVGTSIN
jgi:hypothetical protein